MTEQIEHPSWCAQPHHSTLHASEGYMLFERPMAVYLHIERDDSKGAPPAVVLSAVLPHAQFDVPMSPVDADALRAKLAELVTLAVMP